MPVDVPRMSSQTRADDPPVTVAIAWRVVPEKLLLFDALLQEFMDTAARHPGHQGVQATGPVSTAAPVYRVLVRFDTQSHFDAWQGSAECRRLVSRASGLVVEPANIEVRSGLEAWFPPVQDLQRTPDRWKTSLLMWAVLFPLTLGFRWLFLVADVPLAPVLQSGLMMALEIGLVSYLIMPFLAKALRSWLYPPLDATTNSAAH